MGRDRHFLMWLFGPVPDAHIWANEEYAMLQGEANDLNMQHNQLQAKRCSQGGTCRICSGRMYALRCRMEEVRYDQ